MEKYLYYYALHSQYVEPTDKPAVSYCELENEVHYHPIPHDYKKDYFTIESLEDNNTIYLKASKTAITKTVSVSTDNGETWSEYTSSTGDSGTTLTTLNKGGKLLVKGENSTYASDSYSNYNQFNTTGQFKVYGNIMSLISGDSFANADELTATNTFSDLFSGCTGLTSADNLVLPATTLASGCYWYMFNGCTSLVNAPTLPATTLPGSCYRYMFTNCTSLVTAPELPATTLTNYCYSGMFEGCTSLVSAPTLPATTLTNYCYSNMFQGCTSLNYIKAMFTTTPSTTYTQNWVRGVASTGTFVKNAAATWNVSGVNGIPTNWTVETASN